MIDKIPNDPSLNFVIGFVAGEIVVIVLWVVLEWIARGK